MTTFYWVRHGPTHAQSMVGWTDLPADLSDAAAIARLDAFLPDAPVRSSDLIRATATADAITGNRPRLPHAPELREFHYGAWENLPFDAIDSAELRSYFDTPGAQRAPNGESWDDVSARVNAYVERLTAQGGTFILVAHMGVILTQWARATGSTPYQALAQKIDNLSVTKIIATPRGLRPEFANHTP